IVCTSSVSASRGFREHAVYGGSKCAIEGFVRNLAVDLGARGITINAIAPGATKTDMYSEAVKKYGDGSDVPIAMRMVRRSP
ncbi:SDR family oxidoreductase, partial [Enterococcus faecalis]|uniref:SDR family oxidoreductase n=1 Tax=Enterococcus faecalis TaxID=1351 RepID=UPI00403F5140